MAIKIHIDGLDKMMKTVHADFLLGTPLKRFFNRSVMYLESSTKEKTPVDTGLLRSSITHLVDSRAVPLWGEAGTRTHYGPHVEFGTKPHWPPISIVQPGGKLAVWAIRHGMNPAQAWWAIGLKGTKGRFMFTKAFREGLSTVQRFLDDAGKDIKKRWESGS